MNDIAIVIQARVGSTRLPGKVLRKLAGKTVIQRVIEACKRADVGDVYVAIPNTHENRPLAQEAEAHGAIVVGGSEQDVLGRYVEAAAVARTEYIIRVTADCPLIDHRMIRLMAECATDAHTELLYHGHTNDPDGTDCEIFYWGTLLMADQISATDEREHVTTWMRRQYSHPDVPSDPATKFSIDTEEDFARCEMLLATVGEGAPWQAYVAKLKEIA